MVAKLRKASTPSELQTEVALNVDVELTNTAVSIQLLNVEFKVEFRVEFSDNAVLFQSGGSFG